MWQKEINMEADRPIEETPRAQHFEHSYRAILLTTVIMSLQVPLRWHNVCEIHNLLTATTFFFLFRRFDLSGWQGHNTGHYHPGKSNSVQSEQFVKWTQNLLGVQKQRKSDSLDTLYTGATFSVCVRHLWKHSLHTYTHTNKEPPLISLFSRSVLVML